MSTINKVILLGNVGSVDVKTLENDRKIVQISIATSDGYKKGEEFIEKTEWHRCIFTIPLLAERASTIVKGDKVYVEGSISTNSWTTKEGEKKEIKEVSCVSLKVFVRSQKDSQSTGQPTDAHSPIASESKPSGDDGLPF
jgi:single-strand DNA-binding protein